MQLHTNTEFGDKPSIVCRPAAKHLPETATARGHLAGKNIPVATATKLIGQAGYVACCRRPPPTAKKYLSARKGIHVKIRVTLKPWPVRATRAGISTVRGFLVDA